MKDPHTIHNIRRDYMLQHLSEEAVADTPVEQFSRWWNDAITSNVDEVNAMTLATASNDGLPSARIVLLKGFNEEGFVFFTNYQSYKAKNLEENPRACLVFFWKELERQVRITGLVSRVTDAESDEYFNSRPEASRIGAWTSPQSTVIISRQWLEEKESEFIKSFMKDAIPRPPHWGGYRVKPVSVEFWQGRPGRLHDRIQYSLEEEGNWRIERLAP